MKCANKEGIRKFGHICVQLNLKCVCSRIFGKPLMGKRTFNRLCGDAWNFIQYDSKCFQPGIKIVLLQSECFPILLHNSTFC